MGEYRRLDEIARVTVTFATNLDFGAFLLTGLNVSRGNLATAAGKRITIIDELTP
jgi:hypothetical protein